MKITRLGNYVLGIEIGVASLGWAALNLDAEGNCSSILAMGVRKFPCGTTGDVESGRDESRNARRQLNRSRRVRLAQRVRRLRTLWEMLQGGGLLPAGSFHERDTILKALDAHLGKSPYELRTNALDGAVSPHALGRAIYHIAQRRGFQSNRRIQPKDEDELGVVKSGIKDLEEAMQTSGARTLGEHLFLSKDVPLRRRWTSRQMYRDEVALMLAAQAPHHTPITDVFTKRLCEVIFYQQKPQSQAYRIARCDLEPHRRRTPMACLDAQEMRVLARVNDLRLVDDVGVEPVEITSDQRETLLALLRNGDATFTAIRKALKLDKTVRFNMERVDEKALIGMRTERRMRDAMGTAWDALPHDKQSALVDDMINIDDDAGLRRRLATFWKLPEPLVELLLATQLEPSYAALSHKAISRLLPELRAGVSFATARKKLYPEADHHDVHKTLPMVQSTYRQLANPLVARALSELRAVVNALIAKHGLPSAIRVSLMRQLRLGRKAREMSHFAMRRRHKLRGDAKARILRDLGVQEPTPQMVDKLLLAEECGWVCPFTGKTISIRSLVGGDPRFTVAHIIPFHQSLDDSFENKTLCHVSVQVEPKAVRPVNDAVLDRFSKLTGHFAKEKLRRVKMTPEEIVTHYSETGIASRFVDACYVSRMAVDYLSRLYPSNRSAVQVVRGGMVRYVKEACGLQRIDVPRGNYRRHAIEAAANALCDTSIVRKLCSAAKSAMPGKRRLSPELVLPWTSFALDVANAATDIVVSTRVERRARGPLHEETFYRKRNDGTFSIRKHIWQLTSSDIEAIQGDDVRKLVIDKIASLGGGDPRKLFVDAANRPIYHGNVVRAVRVLRKEQYFDIGASEHKRWVATAENHHAAIFVRGTKAGRIIVSQFEAQKRCASREAIIQYPSNATPLMSLAVGETVELDKKLYTVRSVSKDPRISFTEIDDGRTLKEVIADKRLVRMSVDQLYQRRARKVLVDAIGVVSVAND
jgi:CRISPR-associated endonuclease Csn1